MDRIWIAALASHAEAVDAGDVVLVNPFTVVVVLLDNSDTSWCHKEHRDSVLLALLPYNSWVGRDWLTLKEN